MRNLRLSRKLSKPVRKQFTINARDIILSIFAVETQDQKLEYSRTNWRSTSTGSKTRLQVDSLMKINYQPLKYLFPFLESIANQVDIDTCNFLFIDGNSLKVVHKDRKVSINKTSYSGSKLKYWLSNIYFSRYRKNQSDRVLTEPKATEREVVHVYQENQYMPKVIRGVAKGSTPIVRKLTVSNEGGYMRNTEKEKKPFCIVYNINGSEQEFNFSQILSFVDYPFNLKDMIYIKILPSNIKNNIPISLRFVKSNASNEDIHKIVKFCHIYDRVQGWEFAQQQMETLKINYIANKQYQNYCSLLVLEVVAFLKIKKQLQVEMLESEWIRTTTKGVVLTNVSKFVTSQLKKKKTQAQSGLQTLYNKIFPTPRSPKKTKKYNPYCRSDKRVKSQEKQSISLLQMLKMPQSTTHKTRQPSSRINTPEELDLKRRNTGKSQVLRDAMSLLVL